MNEEIRNNANSELNKTNNSQVGFEAINNLVNQQNNLLEQQQAQQRDIINQGTQMEIDQLNRNKEEIDREATKNNRGLYTEYQKAINPYGANAEALASRGLGNSGYAETTNTRLFNTYQKNVTDTLNNATKLKSDFDFEIQQAMKSGNLKIAESALQAYQQKMQLLTQEYEMKNDYDKYLYQQQRDTIADNQWEKEWQEQLKQNALQEEWNQKNFEYQKERDAIEDDRWQKEYNLSLASKKSSGSGSRSSGGSSGSGSYITDSGNYISDDSKSTNWAEIIEKIKQNGTNAVRNAVTGAYSSALPEFVRNLINK